MAEKAELTGIRLNSIKITKFDSTKGGGAASLLCLQADLLRRFTRMNKSELVEQIVKRSNLPNAAVRRALDAMLDTISEALSEGDRVQLVGFGSFKVTDRKAREGRNPKTGEVIQIPASKTPSFTAGAELKKIVNGR